MRIPIDADLIVFLFTTYNVLSSMPRLRRIPTSRVPMHYEIEEVRSPVLTERQARYFAPFDEKLAAINYWPVCTYRVTNYGHNLIRNYVNPAETSRCVVMIHESVVKVKGKPSATNSCTLSFHTRFTDSTILTTRNMQVKSLMDRPPYQVVQERPEITEPTEMKREHDRKAQSMGCPAPPPSDAEGTFKNMQAEHLRFSEYQVSRGTYKLQPDGKSYASTDKVRWRGIRNHLNPFAHRFSMRRFLPATLVGIALPLFAVVKLAPAAADAAHSIGFPSAIAAASVTLACYLIAGAVIGYLLERHTFIWTFLLTYLTIRIFPGVMLGPLPYSAFAGAVGYSVAQAKKHRRAVLVTQTIQ